MRDKLFGPDSIFSEGIPEKEHGEVVPDRVSAGAKISEVPGPYFIGLLRGVSGRSVTEADFPGRSAAYIQSTHSEKEVKSRENICILCFHPEACRGTASNRDSAHPPGRIAPRSASANPPGFDGARKVAAVEPPISIRGMLLV